MTDDDRSTTPWTRRRRRSATLRFGRLVVDLIGKSVRDRVNGLSAESAFFSVLSLFPGLMILAATLGWLDRVAGATIARRAEGAVLDLIGAVLTDRAGGVIQAVRALFDRGRGGVLTSAAVLAAWSMSNGFAAIIRALDRAYGLTEKRAWINLRLTSVLLALGTAAVVAIVLAMAVAGPLLGRGESVAEHFGFGGPAALARRLLRIPMAVAVVVLWTTTLYHLAPNSRAPWKRDLPGALFAGVTWMLVSYGFSLYLRASIGMNPIFGLLGGALSLMIWVYLLCLTLIVGGELNALLLERAGIERRP